MCYHGSFELHPFFPVTWPYLPKSIFTLQKNQTMEPRLPLSARPNFILNTYYLVQSELIRLKVWTKQGMKAH